ncbi:MAG: hypothetical protein IT290_08460 [Deltaproteobacteria bacterium]|nr:hypothetical protein [Deltaproteobacteria bacterium]
MVRELPWEECIRFELPGRKDRAVLAIGGFGSNPVTVRPLADHLNSTFGAHVIGRSLPRHGEGERAFRMLSPSQLFFGVKAMFDHAYEQNPQPWILSGYSFSAVPLTMLAALYPDRVRALILTSPAFKIASPYAATASWTILIARYALTLGPVVYAGTRAWSGYREGGAEGLKRAVRPVAAATAGMLIAREALSYGHLGTQESTVVDLEEGQVRAAHHRRRHLYPASAIAPLQPLAKWMLTRNEFPIFGAFGSQDTSISVQYAREMLERIPTSVIREYDADHRLITDPLARQQYLGDAAEFCNAHWR